MTELEAKIENMKEFSTTEIISDWTPRVSLPKSFLDVGARVQSDRNPIFREDPAFLKQAFSGHNPLFQEIKTWLGSQGDSARLAGFIDPRFSFSGQPAAFFGFWETINDYAANLKLFSQFEEWVRTNKINHVYGPINFSTMGNYRLRLSHFNEESWFISEPTNPSHYPELLKRLGYSCQVKYFSYVSEDKAQVNNWVHQNDTEPLRKFVGTDLTFIPFKPDDWKNRLDDLHHLTNLIFADNPGFIPIDLPTFKNAFNPSFLNKICPETSVIAQHRDGTLAGYCINFPDYVPLMKATDVSHAEISYDLHISQLSHPTLLIKTAGIIPKYRKQGFSFIAMLIEVLKKSTRYEKHILCLMREGNFPDLLSKQLSNDARIYGLFHKELGPSRSF